jgi:plasmid stabilization system protein ParE
MWGEAQAERYIEGIFAAIERIETREVQSRPVPAELGVDGYVVRFERHFIYWKRLANGDVGVFTILHERMHQIDWLRDDFFGS